MDGDNAPVDDVRAPAVGVNAPAADDRGRRPNPPGMYRISPYALSSTWQPSSNASDWQSTRV